MAKGVKKIKKLSNSSISGDYYKSGDVICINPNQEASFVVGEWYNETTEEERRNINWLWMDQNKIEKFKETRKPEGEPYGITLPKKLCGIYAYYLETSLYGGHNPRNTGVYVFGKCEKKITSASWSKKRNAADNSQINYGQDLFITLETEGLNGDTLKLELYSQKGSKLIDSVKEKCVDGIFKGKFKIKSFNKEFPGLPETSENFYIKVIDFEKSYIKNVSGNDKILSFNVIQIGSIITIPVFEIPTNTAPLIIDDIPRVEEVKTEGIITAYFAKEEFTKETAEVDGKHEYKFTNANIKYDKNKIAGIIKSKVDALFKADKKYAKFDDIKNALAEESYAKDTTITFNLCKLGAEYKKINSAPLEEEVYVIAKTFLLDGKEVSITIKEKEAIVVDADAAVPILEAKENGEELTILNATVENGIAKVKVKLRPKADDALATWKEKLAGNKKDGTHKYTVKNAFTVSGDLDAIAASIEKKSNAALAPNHVVKKEEIKSLLTEDASYTIANSFEIHKYKKEKTTEMLWLKAECQGDTIKHECEFLKRDGEYFVIGKKCICEARIRAFLRMLRVGEGTGELIKAKDKKTNEIIYIPHDFEKGYTTAFGGNHIANLDDHPKTDYGGSSAAGAYQVMPDTWDDAMYAKNKKIYKIDSFSKENQDKFSVLLMKHHPGCSDLLKLLLNGQTENSIRGKGSRIWASLPEKGDTSRYLFRGEPQPVTPMKTVLEHFEKFLKEELAEKSPLHLKKGFLKEFGVCCNCGVENKKSDGKWHDPVDNPICTIFTQSQTSGEFNHSGKHWGIFGNTRDGAAHSGLDLFAKTGENIYACVDGTVYNRRWHGGYGNTITIKVNDTEAFLELKKDYDLQYEKDGEINQGASWSEDGDIFLFYGHLDSVNEYTFGQEVKCGDILGTTGRSGVEKGTCAPHLHFEIFSKYIKPSGTIYCINPALFVDYKTFDNQSESEKETQQEEAKRGKIKEVDGSTKIDNINNLF